MADPLGTLLQVVEVVGKAIEIYKKIQDAPDQIRRIGDRMGILNTTLGELEVLLRADEKRALSQVRPALSEELLIVIENIRKDSEEVKGLFVKWDRDIGPWGMQFRFKFAAQAYFALGSSSDKLEALDNSISRHLQHLGILLQALTYFGVNQLLVAGQNPAVIRRPSPSPEPQPLRTDFRIIFIDPYNDARSLIAEAYINLLRGWTLGTGGRWMVQVAHSAGFFVRSRSEVADTISGMKVLYPSYQLGIKEGFSPPNPTALAALFDNKLFNYPYKQDTKKSIESRLSRGITKNIFKTYDYVLVFTDREEHNLIRLRQLLINNNGRDAVTANRKGKVMHLGRYLSSDRALREIVKPTNEGDRDQWNAKVDQIKTSVKAFLTRELDWKQPLKGAWAT